MKRFFPIFMLLLAMTASLGFTACENDEGTESIDKGWQTRNTQAFREIYKQALQAEAAGDPNWRVIKNYGTTLPLCDTNCIVVRIDKAGTGSGCPLYTDSVRINYQGRLMPTDEYPDGKQFDHSGFYNDYESIFSPALCRPATFCVSNTVEGFTTALQHMHIGDVWHVYMPYQMGYKTSAFGKIPACSMLVFDIQLLQYARAGVQLPEWQ